MKNYAFIFARGGSKGLPRKNVRYLAGKPLITYSIEVAMASTAIEKVFVSTDDEEIAEISEQAGAILIKRPNDLAGDNSPEWLSWRHAVDWVTSRFGPFDNFISLPATSPLRNISDVDAAIQKRTTNSADICISVTESNRSPYFNMIETDSEGVCKIVCEPKDQVSRRQDAPKVYDITTVAYCSTPDFIMEKSGIFEGTVVCIYVPKERAIDIDDIFDFMLAEAILKEKNG